MKWKIEGNIAELNPKRKIVIVGGGFARIQLARKLDKDLFDVLLIDKINPDNYRDELSTFPPQAGHANQAAIIKKVNCRLLIVDC